MQIAVGGSAYIFCNNRGYFSSLKHEVIFVWDVLGLKVSSFYCMFYECCLNS